MKQNTTEVQNYVAGLFNDPNAGDRISSAMRMNLSGLLLQTAENKKLLISEIKLTGFSGQMTNSNEGREDLQVETDGTNTITRVDELEAVLIVDSIDAIGSNGEVEIEYRIYTLPA